MRFHLLCLATTIALAAPSLLHAQSLVSPTGVTLNASSEFYPVVNLVNGSGLSATPTLANFSSVTHAGAGAADLWVTDAVVPDYFNGGAIPVMTFSFDQAYDFTHVITWGYSIIGNDSSAITVEFSTDGGASFPTSANIVRDAVNAGTPNADLQPLGGVFNANAIRFQITDNFLELGPGGDRAGLGEVRFLESVIGFPAVEINRDNGEIVFRNGSASGIDFAGFGLTSANGALDPGSWLSISDNYDEGVPGSISGDRWVEFSNTNFDLSEGTLGTASLGGTQSVSFGAGTWLRNPTEDIVASYLDANTGEIVNLDVTYVGTTQTTPYEIGDLNFDGDINELDWPIYRAGYRADLTGLSPVAGYYSGDLNGDGVNNATDFGIFKSAYELNNPGSSFAALLGGSQVPEPSTISLAILATVGLLAGRRAIRGEKTMKSRFLPLMAGLVVVAMALVSSPHASAALIAHYEFEDMGNIGLDSAGGDNNGTALGSDVSFAAGRVGASSLAIDATGIGLELANPGTFQPLTTFSIASFVRPNFDGGNWGNNGSVGRIFGALGIDADGVAIPGTTNTGYGFGVINNGQLRYTTYGIQDYNQPAGVVDDRWQHIAVSVVEGNATFYLNGVNVGTINGQNAGATTNPFHIGASAISNSDRFLGLIDDLRVYDNALSDAEVLALASIPEPSTISLSILAVFGLLAGRRVIGGKKTMKSRFLPLMAGLVVVAMALVSSPHASAALVAHYEFEDMGNIGLDSAGADNNGTALGSDVSFAAGRVGASSLAIDGTGIGLELANPGTFQPLTTFSIASFVRPNFDGGNWGNGSGVGRIFGALGIDAAGVTIPGTTNSGYGFGVINNGQLRYTTYGIQDYNQPAGVVDDQWQHIAVSVVGGNATFYLNGNNVGTINGQNPGATTNPYHIGASAISNSDRFLGLIDDLRVYDNALSDADVLALASVPAPLLSLEVNTGNGITRLRNEESFTFTIDQYEVLSPGGSLSTSGWDSIQANGQNGYPQGNGTGNGWEVLGTSTANFVGEAYLLGASPLAGSASINLGSLFNTGVGTQDLEFFYRTADGTLSQGVVNYVTTGPIAGDFNGDGIVNAADYTVWRDNQGAANESAFAPGTGNGGGIDASDYAFWRSNFGSTSGSLAVGSGAVPEPSSVMLVMIAGIGAILFTLHRRGIHRADLALQPQTIRACAIAIVAWAVAGSAALATVTNDRQYLFGEGAGENGSHGALVGSGHSISGAGDTLDEIGPSGAFLDLVNGGAPTYQNVSPTGLMRPDAAPGALGVRFNGSSDFLNGTPLNRPDELATIIGTYPINYDTITRRGLQLWVYPTASALGSSGSPTTFQSIVFDSIFSGGPAINAQGQWTQINSFHADGASGVGVVPATVDVPAGDTWYHVMHHNYALGDPNSPRLVAGSGTARPFTSVMYVDGVAVSANNDNVSTGGNPAFVGKLVVGAAEVNGDGLAPVYGNYFNGVVDNLEMYVVGDNTGVGGMNYGSFNLFADNEWIRQTIIDDPVLQGVLTPGDVNRDGSVNGDGMGSVTSDDVAAFIAGWGSTNVLQGNHSRFTVGDWNTWSNGDLNHDGRTDFADWYILRANHENPGSLDLVALLGGREVPEPGSIALACLAGAAVLLRYRRR